MSDIVDHIKQILAIIMFFAAVAIYITIEALRMNLRILTLMVVVALFIIVGRSGK